MLCRLSGTAIARLGPVAQRFEVCICSRELQNFTVVEERASTCIINLHRPSSKALPAT